MSRLGCARLRGLLLATVSLSLAPWALAAQEPSLELAAKVGFPVEPGVWHLDGTDPTLPLDDLEPLRTILGSKVTVVGLGESIHTSGGYYEAKHRLFRYLVEKMGFRAIAFETPWLAAETAEPYVQTCEGSPNTASRGFFGVWRSAELSALLGWMCEWNAAHPNPKDRVHVFGFDIQGQARPDVQALQEFLGRVGRDPAAEPWAGLERCGFVEGVFNFSLRVPEAEAAECDASVQAVEGLFVANARTFGRGARKVDFEWAKLRLAGLRAWLDEMIYNESDPQRSFAARDRGMAALLLGIRKLRYPKAKVAVWAHNGHITRDPEAYDLTTMGSFLDAELPGKYAVIGLVSHAAAIDWPPIGCGVHDVPGPGSVEELLHGLGEPALLVDLRFPGTSTPLLEPGRSYELNSTEMVPARAFDVLLFLDRSPKMTPLQWRPC
jgi:erythromycin esterase-like protein